MADVTGGRGAAFLTGAADPQRAVIPEDLREEERMLVRSVRDFAEREVRPLMPRLVARDPEVSRGLFRKAAELGLFMAEVPEEDGGLDLSVLAVMGMLSSKADLGPLGTMIIGHQGIGTLPIVYFGTPEQKATYLPGCLDGTLLSAFALTEPSSGSDAMNIRTKAVLDESGTHYVLNGAKQWISNAAWADVFVLFAKVDGRQFTAFLVERDTPGLSVGEPEKLLGQDGSSVSAVSLKDVRLPIGNVLGEVGKGYKVAFCTLNMGRLKLAASSATGAKLALEVAAKYATERIQFGVPIARFGLIRRKLADMGARAYAAESVAYRTAGMVYRALRELKARGNVTPEQRLDALSEYSAECALSKVYGSEAYNALADEAVQVFGGYGFSEHYPAAKMYRDSRVSRLYEGTNEVCRLYAQRTIFRALSGGSESPIGLGMALEELRRIVAPERPHPDDGSSGGLRGTLAAVARLKQAYLMLVEAAVAEVGADGLKDPGRQQFLASLADVAMEIFASESVGLRVAKLEGTGPPEAEAVRSDLAALVLERSAERSRAEARTLLGELHPGEEGRKRLSDVDVLLPAPVTLVESRGRVTEWLVAHEGRLPGDEG